MDGGSPSTSNVGGGREDASAELDQFFLEFHDQFSKDARERFAKVADKIKKLSETSASAAQTTPLPRTPPPSSDQELARREEEGVEAIQSSGELTKGEVAIIHCTHDQRTLDVKVGRKWY